MINTIESILNTLNGSADLQTQLYAWVNAILGLLAVAGIGFLGYAGFRLSQAHDEEKLQSAKKSVVYSFLGLSIIGSAFLIGNLAINFLS